MECEIKRKSFNLELGNIEKFQVAGFERKVYDNHVKKLKKSIMEQGLLKNDVTVWESNGSYFVIDGQHRIQALHHLLEDEWKKSFMINLIIMPGIDGIEAKKRYLEINMNMKSLTTRDILKVFDDGKTIFFNSTKRYCSHYGSNKTYPYFSILQMLKYAKTGSSMRMQREEIEQWCKDAEKWEMERVYQFLEALFEFTGKKVTYWLWRPTIIGNIFRCYWENFEKIQPKISKFFSEVENDRVFKNNDTIHTAEAISMIYGCMNKKLEKIGVK